jgi:hypothetical protein
MQGRTGRIRVVRKGPGALFYLLTNEAQRRLIGLDSVKLKIIICA